LCNVITWRVRTNNAAEENKTIAHDECVITSFFWPVGISHIPFYNLWPEWIFKILITFL